MTREEAITTLKEMHESFDEIHENTNGDIGYEQMTALDMAIEALSAEEAVWNEYEAEFTDLPDIPRYYYEKVVGNMAHEINMLKEQLESADAVPQLRQTDTLIIADALRYLAKDTERHLVDRTRADALRQQFLKYGASMCKGGAE